MKTINNLIILLILLQNAGYVWGAERSFHGEEYDSSGYSSASSQDLLLDNTHRMLIITPVAKVVPRIERESSFTWCYVSPRALRILGQVFINQSGEPRFYRGLYCRHSCAVCLQPICYYIGQFFNECALCSNCMRNVFGQPIRPKIFLDAQLIITSAGWKAYTDRCTTYYEETHFEGTDPIVFTQALHDLEEREIAAAHQAVRNQLARRKWAKRKQKLVDFGRSLWARLCRRRGQCCGATVDEDDD